MSLIKNDSPKNHTRIVGLEGNRDKTCSVGGTVTTMLSIQVTGQFWQTVSCASAKAENRK